MMPWRWLWRGEVTRVIDGDTIEVIADRGYFQYEVVRLRLKDIDAPEHRPRKAGRTEESLTAEKEAAKEATDWLSAILCCPPATTMPPGMAGVEVVFQTTKRSFDRYVAVVWISDGEGGWHDGWENSINQMLVDSGYAKLIT